jgi:hypothetical protein
MASAGAAPARVSDQPQSAVAAAKPTFLTRISTGPACFYWIAALTILNSLVVISGGSLHFAIGLGLTAGIDVRARELGLIGTVLDLLISGTIAGIFWVLGNLAGKRIRWAFLAGIALYGFDGMVWQQTTFLVPPCMPTRYLPSRVVWPHGSKLSLLHNDLLSTKTKATHGGSPSNFLT